MLDEPAAQQSDPTVLNLQLRSLSKQSNLQPMPVSSIEAADKNPKKISAWINSINDLHKSKPPPHVSYSKPMPDIEKLMQVIWNDRPVFCPLNWFLLYCFVLQRYNDGAYLV